MPDECALCLQLAKIEKYLLNNELAAHDTMLPNALFVFNSPRWTRNRWTPSWPRSPRPKSSIRYFRTSRKDWRIGWFTQNAKSAVAEDVPGVVDSESMTKDV
jgi:hypothetical protein